MRDGPRFDLADDLLPKASEQNHLQIKKLVFNKNSVFKSYWFPFNFGRYKKTPLTTYAATKY